MRRDELIGRTIAKRFRVKRVLGEGGMATVFVAEQNAEPREIALKILRPELCADKTFAKRFEREARAAARVQHPSSVTIFEAGVDGDLSYIAMELLRGDDLFALLERHGALSPRAAATIVAEVCDALAVAHGLGIVHRDLKPENIMVVRGPAESERGPESVPLPPGARVKVLDFGIAKLLDKQASGPRPPPGRVESPTNMTAVTRVGTLIGTPAYMSPEQCALQPVDTRSDIYTCGLLLFQMVSGRLPFDGPTPLHIATKHIHEEAPPLRSFVPDADPALEALILKALAKRPADRWLTARALAGALRKLLPALPDRPYSISSGDPDSEATPALIEDSITSLRDVGLPASLGEPPSEPMVSAKTVVADGLAAPPPSVVVREPEVPRRPLAILRRAPEPPRKPLAILARHDDLRSPSDEDTQTAALEVHPQPASQPEPDSGSIEPPPATPTLPIAPEDAESAVDVPIEEEEPAVESEPEDLASTLVRGAPSEVLLEGSTTAPLGARQPTMQSAAPALASGERASRAPVAEAPTPHARATDTAPLGRGPAAVQTLVTGQPGPAPTAAVPVAATAPAAAPALVAVPARNPVPAMPAASVILSPSVAAPLPQPPPPRAPMPSVPDLSPPRPPMPSVPDLSPPRPPMPSVPDLSSHLARAGPAAPAPTFGIPAPPAPPALAGAGPRPEPLAGTTLSRALWFGVLIGVLGSALLFALAYFVFLAK